MTGRNNRPFTLRDLVVMVAGAGITLWILRLRQGVNPSAPGMKN
jgi:hypothetical protein